MRETICYCPKCEGWGTAPEIGGGRVQCDVCDGEGIVRCIVDEEVTS
jgi:hypothetical protein